MSCNSLSHSIMASSAGLLLAAAAPLAAQEQHRLSGDAVAVWNLAGALSIEPGSGSDVVVEVTRRGRDAGRLRIETGALDGRQTLRVVYPGNDIVYPEIRRSRTELRVRQDGTFNRGGGRRVRISGTGSGLQAAADITVRVPRGKDVSAHLAAGSVEVRNVDGVLRVATSMGSVTTENTLGNLTVRTGSGRVDVRRVAGELAVSTGSGRVNVEQVTGASARMRTGSGGIQASGVAADQVTLNTGSGAIRLELSAPAREVQLRTGSGSIRVHGGSTPRRVESLTISTGSGSIEAEGVLASTARLRTGSGGVRLALLDGQPDVRISTGSGGVSVGLAEGVGLDVDIRSNSGIDVSGVGLVVSQFTRRAVRGQIGAGGGRLVIGTGSGRVTLARR